MKSMTILLFALMISISQFSCEKKDGKAALIEYNSHSVEGFWKKEVGSETFFFIIDRTLPGLYQGTIVTYRKGSAVSDTRMGAINVKDMNVEMVTNAERNIIFKGRLDSLAQVIRGKLHYADGTTVSFPVERYSGPECQKIRRRLRQSEAMHFENIENLPETGCIARTEVATDVMQNGNTEKTLILDEKDIIAVINRWHGDIFPDHQNRSTAVLLAFLLDPVTRQISDEWLKVMAGEKNTVDKIRAVNNWTTEHFGYTQVEKAFSGLPGNDPWGIMSDNHTPALRKLIPSEMAAMSMHTGKISGKCFTLVNLITSCFVQLGVDPDDIIVLMTETEKGRHAMALVNYEDELILVNLMMVGMLNTLMDRDFRPYHITGIYNHKFSRKVNLQIGKVDLKKLMEPSDKPFLESFLDHFNLRSLLADYNFSEERPLNDTETLKKVIFLRPCTGPETALARYAHQNLAVSYPGYYLKASAYSSVVRKLALSMKSEYDVFHWIRSHVRYGSIFSDSEERLMTADQVLIFQRGSYKDQAVLACTLLHHLGIDSIVKITMDDAFVDMDGKIYDIKRGTYTNKIRNEIVLVLS